jgi:hypothetical protein
LGRGTCTAMRGTDVRSARVPVVRAKRLVRASSSMVMSLDATRVV